MLRRLQTFVHCQPVDFNVLYHACRRSAFPNVRCAQRSCARQMTRVQVSTIFLWNCSKLVETRWFPFFVLFFTVSWSKVAFPSGFKALGCVPLWKGKADPRRCSNHRGTQVSNVLPSILIEVVKTRAEERLQSSYPTPPCGREHGCTTFAMHFARSFVQYAAGGGYNACLLFADLEKAYDMVVKRWLSDAGALKLTLRVSCSALALTVMSSNGALDYLRCDGSVIHEAGLELELVDLVERIYFACVRMASRRIKRLLLKRNVVDDKVVLSVASFFRCCTRDPHVWSPAVHVVRTCRSRSLLALLVRHGHALLTP